MEEAQKHHVGWEKNETKEYIAYNSTNDTLELTHGDRHQKMVGWGLGGGTGFTAGGKG